MTISGGGQANYTGNTLEQFVEHRLLNSGYVFVRPKQFAVAVYNQQPVYTKQFHAGTSIYGTPIFSDFAIYHPEKWPKCLIIEAKWQQVGGSVDEKYPYLVLNIQRCHCYPTILLARWGWLQKGG